MMKNLVGSFAILLLAAGCAGNRSDDAFIQDNIRHAVAHHTRQTDIIEASGKILNPRTITEDGSIVYIPVEDWTSGFFPGSMWLTYELTKDTKWKNLAEKYTEALDSVKYLTWHHDVGFMIGCSFLNGYYRAGKQEYKEVIIQAARSLCTRFHPGAGVIQSWDVDKGWQAERGWACPVIIDNMMNLELLFEASILSGDPSFAQVAVKHANTTMEHQFRPEHSSFHVIDYDPATGEVRHKHTAQGYAHESAWARGQAWGLYGYITCYRYKRDPKYLEQAEKIYDFIFNHPNLPEDLIPYWDYNVPEIPDTPRDASAAACTAAALYEMHVYLPEKGYKEMADRIMKSLASPVYRANVGENGNFILMHSVGSIPHGVEIDVPLNYADYYFLEALIRKRDLEKEQS